MNFRTKARNDDLVSVQHAKIVKLEAELRAAQRDLVGSATTVAILEGTVTSLRAQNAELRHIIEPLKNQRNLLQAAVGDVWDIVHKFVARDYEYQYDAGDETDEEALAMDEQEEAARIEAIIASGVPERRR